MPYLKLVESRFLGRPWWLATTDEDLLVILTYQADESIVAIRQARPGIDARVLSPPMGTFAAGSPQDLTSTARTEAEHETGFQVTDISHHITIYRSPGLTNQRAHVYRAILLPTPIGQHLHADEDIEVVNFPPGTALADVIARYPADAIDAAFMYYFLTS